MTRTQRWVLALASATALERTVNAYSLSFAVLAITAGWCSFARPRAAPRLIDEAPDSSRAMAARTARVGPVQARGWPAIS